MTHVAPGPSARPDFLDGGGETGALIRVHDWTSTPLGPIESWPQSLKTATSILLRSPVPIVLLWGEDGIMLYNDAYSAVAGARHPRLLGCKVREGWPEVADFNDNVMKVGLAGGTLAYRDQELTLFRRGSAEQVWMNLDYSPVVDENGKPAGVIAFVVETTERVLAERRAAAERDRLSQMFEQAPGLMAMLAGSEHVFEMVNPAYMQLIGDRDVLGRPIREVLPDLEGQGYFELLDEVYRSGKAFVGAGMDVRIQPTPGGPAELRTVDFVLQPLTDTAGAVTGIFIEAHDVTGRIQAEQALKGRQSRQALLLNLLQEQRETEDPEKIMLAAVEAVGRHLGAHRVGFFTVASPETLEFGVSWTDGTLEPLKGHQAAMSLGPRILADLRGGRTCSVSDTAIDPPNADSAFGDTGARSSISAPILRNGEWYAGLYVNQAQVRQWTADELALVQEVADRTWDAVERVNAVTGLQESQARLARALEAGELGAWELDLVTHEAWRSLRHDNIFGYATLLPDWTYVMFLDHVHPDDREEVDAKFQEAVTGTGRWDFECRIRRSDGAPRWIWAQGRVEFEEGEPRRMKGMVRDVTERKQLEADLRVLNETLEARVEERTRERDQIWKLSRDPFLIADMEGRWLSVSPAWTAILGWSEQELVGRTSEWMEHPEDHPKTRAEIEHLGSGRATLRFENRFRGKDGSYRWFSWTAVPGDDLLYCVARDITEEKKRLAELAQAQEALRQSQKMEAMGQLTGGVAHDFNNLLTPIIGSLDMLQRRQIGGEREQALIGGALQAADRAKTLVQRLLAFARRQPLQTAAVDVGERIAAIADLLTGTLGPNVKIVLDIPSDLPSALADGNQLEMALLNLAVNARDAMPDGGTLTISAAAKTIGNGNRSKLAPGRYVRLSVTDTGIGMDSATLKRAIEPFYSTKGIGKGTGLGLSMVEGLASQLGGGLTLSSQPGLGTRVDLWLPVSTDAASFEGEYNGQASPTPRPGRALLVDDDPAVRSITADMLAELGYLVTPVESGKEALLQLEGGFPADLIITDHLMPGMTGSDLAAEVRGRWPDVPVLIVSGFAEVEAIAPDLPRLTKPFRQAELADMLATLVRPSFPRRLA